MTARATDGIMTVCDGPSVRLESPGAPTCTYTLAAGVGQYNGVSDELVTSSDQCAAMNKDEFLDLLGDAYAHLYDTAYLRLHGQVFLSPDERKVGDENDAWRIHRLLLTELENLKPPNAVARDSTAWRRYRALYDYYVEGDSPQTVADNLGISSRHFYRERKRALADIGEIWWQRTLAAQERRRVAGLEVVEPTGAEPAGENPRLETLRSEARRIMPGVARAPLLPIIERACALSGRLADRQQASIYVDLPEGVATVPGNTQVVLHMLLTGLEYCLNQPGVTSVTIRLTTSGETTTVTLCTDAVYDITRSTPKEEFQALRELAASQGARVSEASCDGWGLEIAFPLARPITILLVDDNPDFHHLVRRYVQGTEYRVVSAQTMGNALELAKATAPDIIVVDLMMPDEDGFALIEHLRAEGDTKNVAIMVCSVLAERELAMSLGADYFIEKPVSSEALLTALRSLTGSPAP